MGKARLGKTRLGKGGVRANARLDNSCWGKKGFAKKSFGKKLVWPKKKKKKKTVHGAVCGVIGASRPLKVFPQGTDVELGSVRPGPSGLA